MSFEGLARRSRGVKRRFLRGSREISLVPSLHRAATDALIHTLYHHLTIHNVCSGLLGTASPKTIFLLLFAYAQADDHLRKHLSDAIARYSSTFTPQLLRVSLLSTSFLTSALSPLPPSLPPHQVLYVEE